MKKNSRTQPGARTAESVRCDGPSLADSPTTIHADLPVALLKPFELKRQNPHPGPLPSDGRGRTEGRVRRFGQPSDSRSGLASCSLSHRIGEGQGEGTL